MTGMTGRQSTLQHLWAACWARPRGRWPALRWGMALLLPIALLLWMISVALLPADPDLLRITVESQVTGKSIEGATVVVDQLRYVTDASGTITIEPVPAGTDVRVSAPGHESAGTATTGDSGASLVVSLSAVLVLGSVTDIVSGAPVEGADIVVLDAEGEEVATTRTDRSGTFVFKFIPEDAEIAVTHDVYGEYRQRLDHRRSLLIQLDPPPVTGLVVDATGAPIAGATITGGRENVVTGADGTFTAGGIGQEMELTIMKEGIGSANVTVSGTDLGAIRIPASGSTPEARPSATEGGG